jgi:hypothetical protein
VAQPEVFVQFLELPQKSTPAPASQFPNFDVQVELEVCPLEQKAGVLLHAARRTPEATIATAPAIRTRFMCVNPSLTKGEGEDLARPVVATQEIGGVRRRAATFAHARARISPMRGVRRLAAVVALGACAPSPTAPVSVMAIVEQSDGTYQPTQVQLNTISDIVAMKGSVIDIVGNARIVLDPNDPALQTSGLTDQQVEAILLKNKGQAVTASYIERNGVYWPADFHTWNMVTTYYNFEQAFDYYNGLGIFSSDSLGGNTVYYWASFTLVAVSTQPQVDNTLYYSPVQAFLLLPFDQALPLVPLAMNTGVLTHEYSHRIFNLAVYQGQLFPQPLGEWLGTGGPTTQINLLKSIDEGLADYHAFGQSCQSAFGCTTRFLESSLGGNIADQRDMSQPDKCMSTGLLSALCTLNVTDFTNQSMQYQVGTDLAAALYHAGENTGSRQELQKAILASYDDTTPATLGLQQQIYQNLNNPQCVTLGSVANTILVHITDPALQQEMCNQFMDHLQLTRADICPTMQTGPCQQVQCGCPTTSAGGNSCPNLWASSVPPGTNNVCPGF